MIKLVLPQAVWEKCARAASAVYPLEEGGILLGRSSPGCDRTVTHMIGAGPGARRGRTWLEVDDEWQNQQIRELHAAGAPSAYLGEWHSHPDASCGTPSHRDRRTLALLATFRPLACSDPIMLIAYPTEDSWRAEGWHLAGPAGRSSRFFAPALRRVEVQITI